MCKNCECETKLLTNSSTNENATSYSCTIGGVGKSSPPPLIIMEINRLDSNIANLQASLLALRGRLIPVLGPINTNGDKEEPDKVTYEHPSIGGVLASKVCDIKDCIKIIEDISNRLEI